jgi:ABC-type Mn2+/Zn2+ transport system permease subunit
VSQLVEPFLDNEFMQRALLAGILVSISCAIVGTYVVLRGLALVMLWRTASCPEWPEQ